MEKLQLPILIPKDVIQRRFDKGFQNQFRLYIPIVDKWLMVDNSGENFEFIAEGSKNDYIIKNKNIWYALKSKYDGN